MKTLLRPYEGTLPYHLRQLRAQERRGRARDHRHACSRAAFASGTMRASRPAASGRRASRRISSARSSCWRFCPRRTCSSDNCRKEMHYALTKKKPVINVYLEPTELSPGMEMQIGNLFALMKYTYPSEEYFYDKLFSAELLDADKFAGEAAGAAARGARRAAAGEKGEGENAPRRISPPGQARKACQSAEARARLKKRRRGLAAAIIAVVLVGCLIAAGIVGHFTGLLYRFTVKTVAVQTLRGRHGGRSSRTRCSSRPRATMPASPRASSRSRTSRASRRCTSAATGTGLPPRSRAWTRRPPASRRRRSIDPSGQTVTVRRGDIRDLSDLAYFPSLTASSRVQFQSLTSLEQPARLRCGGVRCQRQPAHEPVGHRAAAEAHGPARPTATPSPTSPASAAV